MNAHEVGREVLSVIDAGDAVSLTQDLVRVPSIFPGEAGCAAVLAERYADFGLTLTRQFVDSQRPNILGVLEGAPTGKRLLIEGHTDVVGLGNEAKWTVDPWGGAIDNGRLYGRGSCDMKAGLAAAAIAARAIIRTGVRLGGTLQLAGFVDEENLMTGVKHFVREGGANGLTAAITVEPTFGLSIGTSFCGRTRADVTFFGAPGHTGVPPQSVVGKNAIHMAWRLIKAIEQTCPPHQPHNLYGPTHWQVASITGGDPNEATVPATCTVRVDARPVPGHSSDAVWDYVRELLVGFRLEDAGLEATVDVIDDYGTSSWSTSPESPIVKATQSAYKIVLGSDAPMNRVPQIPPGSGHTLKVSTDVHHLAALGIPCINIGAQGANAHMENEYVNVDQIPVLAKILAMTAVHFLGVEA
jgi:succinyl-diaminopimelate desuccinylase